MKIEDFYKEAHQPDIWVARWIDPHFTAPTDALHQEVMRQWAPEYAHAEIGLRMRIVTGVRKFIYDIGTRLDDKLPFALAMKFDELMEYVSGLMKVLEGKDTLIARMETVHEGVLKILVSHGFPTMTLEAFTANATNKDEWQSLNNEQLFCYYHYILGIEMLMQMEACMYMLDESTPIGSLSHSESATTKKKAYCLLLDITQNNKGTIDGQPIHEWNYERLNKDVTLRDIN